jgi:hypothetical protein
MIKRSCEYLGMTGWEVVGTFVGIPVAVLALIALPIFGPEWWRRRRGHDDDRGRGA